MATPCSVGVRRLRAATVPGPIHFLVGGRALLHPDPGLERVLAGVDIAAMGLIALVRPPTLVPSNRVRVAARGADLIGLLCRGFDYS